MTGRPKAALAALAAILVATVGCGSAEHGPDDGITLVVADGFSGGHPVSKGGSAPFFAYLREHGPEVGLHLDYYGAGQLGKTQEMLTLVRTRAVDMGFVLPAYLADELPLTGVGDLPGLTDDPCTTVQVLDPLVKPGGIIYDKEIEQRGVVPLWGAAVSGIEVFTADRRATRPEDLAGLLVRSPGGVGDRVAKGLGVAPVSLPVGDMYEALSRGTIDGALLPRYAVLSYSFQEVLRYGTLRADLGSSSIWFTINADAWAELDDAQRRVVQEAAEVARAGACTSIAAADAKAVDAMRAAGIQFDEVSPQTRPQWDAALASVRAEWVRDLESAGLDAREVLDAIEARVGGAAK
ncbi:C4-dicarboxylate ABC transporter [Nocardia neocaledoniensis NBRC 108232]|uniref:TRAP-type C4-dicarboxylate transport system substrate-binding protein n=1 Tax=Nocardia neocaledoniensis TaxID=236511 RepID=A0A317N1M8_9NOCA|nr:TRAP transporter substrate-binding protein DctP [Nocardia neocaledoniensis]PWV66860.1 TRAP-type C4-dicarboxylate transport system substrate-binding protein [Nocardia neocaledoniensis]GEM35402.1 C4-dicarboxylate ABC transporter [Nocardia neocaledoniensis NBRC 108232]